MLHSMTGYGSNSFKVQDLEIDIEVKSLNSRYFDSKISIPSSLSTYELEIDNIVKNKLVRGKVDLTIKISGLNNDSVTFNKKVIKKMFLNQYSILIEEEKLLIEKFSKLYSKSNIFHIIDIIETKYNNYIALNTDLHTTLYSLLIELHKNIKK